MLNFFFKVKSKYLVVSDFKTVEKSSLNKGFKSLW
jgi:hypothetical protein